MFPLELTKYIQHPIMQITKKTNRKGFTLVELLVVIAIIAALAAISYGPIMKRINDAARSNAIAKQKQVALSLFSYASDRNGSYPSGSSLQEVFQRLLTRGKIASNLDLWYVEPSKAGLCSRNEPDESDTTVKANEISFGYVAGLKTTDNPRFPILFDSSKSGSSFEMKVWKGSALITRLDQSSVFHEIDSTDPEGTGSVYTKASLDAEGEKVSIMSDVQGIDGVTLLSPSGGS